LGVLGEIHPEVCENYGIKPRVVAFDLDLDSLFAVRGAAPQYRYLPRLPAVTRDLALVADVEVPAAAIAAAITAAAGSRLESLRLFDVFTGEKVGEGRKSLAYSLVLRDTRATLTDADADEIVKKVLAALRKMEVVLRS
jgi:phenylalanyl-tRNA synthetase beta chain